MRQMLFKRNIAGVDDAAVASAIGAAAGSAINVGGGIFTAKKNRQFAREEAEKQKQWAEKMYNAQNAWNYEMWQKENEYNSPEAQVQRLRDAGLNPLNYGLDGTGNAGSIEAAQPLGYERANVGNQPNPFSGLEDAAMRAAQVTSMTLDNEKKKKELGYMDDEHTVDMQIKEATVDEIQTRTSKLETDIKNGEMDVKLKEKDLDKKDAEIACEWARYAGLGLDNNLKEQLNPLLVRAQELENQLNEVKGKYEEQRILGELAEQRAHIAALYAQAALDGAKKEGVKLDNKVKEAESKWAKSNAEQRARILKFTADAGKEKAKQAIYDTDNAKYYSEHYEEAFRNSWSKSGVEYANSQAIGNAIGTFAALGMMLAF